MSEGIKIYFDEDGIAKEYDDTYDITIHCESEEEQNELLDRLNRQWIPVSERLPEEGEVVLVWYRYWRYGEYNNWEYTYGIGYQYEDFWSVIDGGLKSKVYAWMPLPEPYKASPTGAESEG